MDDFCDLGADFEEIDGLPNLTWGGVGCGSYFWSDVEEIYLLSDLSSSASFGCSVDPWGNFKKSSLPILFNLFSIFFFAVATLAMCLPKLVFDAECPLLD